MYTLTKSEFYLEANPKLYQVFSKTSLVYACSFRANIQRKIICGYYFELQQPLIDETCFLKLEGKRNCHKHG